MSYRYSEKNREEYFADGFTILRGLIPPSLLSDLRRETDNAREIARQKDGPQAQRLQPVYAHPELDARPFRDFLALEELQKTVRGILGDQHWQSDIMGVLLEPATAAWATPWHRDWLHHMPSIDPVDYLAAMKNPLMFNQLNAPLYDDHSLWVVPRSHDREDTDAEREVFPGTPPGPELRDDQTPEERELVCSRYVRQMPGAMNVALLAGDCAFYRACQWHLGTYIPYTKRATLHDGFYGPDDHAWRAKYAGGQ